MTSLSMSFENPNYNYETENGGAIDNGLSYGFPGASSHLRSPALLQTHQNHKYITTQANQFGFPCDPGMSEESGSGDRSNDDLTPSEQDYKSFSTFNPLYTRREVVPEVPPPPPPVDDNWVLQEDGQKARQFIESIFQSPPDQRRNKFPTFDFEETEFNGDDSLNGSNPKLIKAHGYDMDSTYFGSGECIFSDLDQPQRSLAPDHQVGNSSGVQRSRESMESSIAQIRNNEVSMTMTSTDHRFGFSVMGGVDEGFQPKIDEITNGSPADHADLEVGDEITEVNGCSMEGCTHGEIISHIHKCIKSRTIKLRVKRSSSGNKDVPTPTDIQDAYVIAVEDQARQRLEELSALHKVRPVDISKLQDFGNNNLNSDLEGLDKDNPVYVTSPEALHSTKPVNPEEDETKQLEHVTSAETTSDICDKGVDKTEDSDPSPVCGETQVNNTDTPVSDSDIPVSKGDVPVSESDVPVNNSDSPVNDEDLTSKVSSSDTEELAETDEQSADMSLVNGYPETHYGGPPGSHVNTYGQAGMRYGGHNLPDTMYDNVEQSADESDVSNGQHREMAIDVPDNFVGRKKEPPRYPSRHSHQGTPPSSGHGTPRHSVQSAAPSQPQARTPDKRDPTHQQPPKMSKEEQIQHFERIKKYQDDLNKRKEQRDRMEAEQEFLRNSLRGSKKLQALEEQQMNSRVLPSGIVNPNYVEEMEERAQALEAQALEAQSLEAQALEAQSKSSTLPIPSRDPHGFMVRKPIYTGDIFTSLQHIQRRLKNIEDQKELATVSKFFQNPRFQQALDIHNKVIEVTLRTPQPFPVSDSVLTISADVSKTCLPVSSDPLAAELLHLLNTPYMKGLMYAHDKVAGQKAAPPKATTEDDERDYLYERASQYGEESIKIVRLQKTADPLGATVRNDGESVVIGRIVKGGAAEKSGLLHEGDEILEINGIDIRGKSVNDVCDLMANLTGTLTFLIIPSLDQRTQPPTDQVVHVRANFSYEPEDDMYIPCRELGISFMVGDILHVINQEDPNWWQAYRDGEDDQTLAGLIPSQGFQEQREAMRQTIVSDSKENSKKKQRCRCVKKTNKKKKKKLYSGSGEEVDTEEILTYEEVALYYPQPNRKRPVVLIGPPNVGRQELRQRLMESNVERFAAAIPHTSRPLKQGENDGKDYHFVPRHIFEEDIKQLKFVEYGEFKKDLYGTSLQAIREIVASGKICVLNLHPQSLRMLKNSDLKPYVVFVAPPNIEKLKQLRQKQGVNLSDDELKEIIEKSREMEENYGHYFDFIITNHDLEQTYQSLLEQINNLEVEPQWVPSFWLS